MALIAVNPANGEPFAEYPEMDDAAAAAALDRCGRAFQLWRRTDFPIRAGLLRSLAAGLRRESDALARLMALEMGKPIRDGRAEAEKCAIACEYYADHGAEFLASQRVATDARASWVAFQPLGVVLLVMPWNFPLWQAFRAAVPAMMAGNGCALKHASNVPGCAVGIEKLFQAAGFPADLFCNLPVRGSAVAKLIEHAEVRGVSLTGSVAAGRAVAAKAGACLKKCVLELGGSDAYIILADADIDLAATVCARSRLTNSGQSCIAAKRFIVVDEVREEFTQALVQALAAVRPGDPRLPDTALGPMARLDLRDELHAQVLQSERMGARLLLGGVVPEGPGAFYPPTVLADVRPGMPAYAEELFGPVAAVIPARGEAEAFSIANGGSFGLGGAVFTRDAARGERLAAEILEAGNCFVNAAVKSDPRLPFGGIKDSGYGRELSGFGIREFVNIKTVWAE